jgi:D-alanyl-D-alanine carboxypeptidase (penicillin-binding protein 5/6)
MESENLSKVVTISKKASHAAPSRAGLKKGDRITIEGLLYAALLKSANDAAVAIAEAVAGSEKRFVSLMNQKALAIGARDTKFINANGLPGSGQYTTALDLSKILNYALKIPKLREIIGTPEAQITTKNGRIFNLRSTDELLWSDEKVIGGKTGYTQKAGHCFVGAAQRETRTILVAVLGSPSRKNLWADTEKLITENLWVEGDGNSFLHGEDFDSSPQVAEASINGIMIPFSGPGLTLFQILQDINLAGSFRVILQPAVPENVIGKPILSGPGFEDFAPGFGPGEFVFESGHRVGAF